MGPLCKQNGLAYMVAFAFISLSAVFLFFLPIPLFVCLHTHWLHIGCRNPAGWLDKWAGSPLPEPLHKSINCSEAYTACPFEAATIHASCEPGSYRLHSSVACHSCRVWGHLTSKSIATAVQQLTDRQNWPDRILQCLPPPLLPHHTPDHLHHYHHLIYCSYNKNTNHASIMSYLEEIYVTKRKC